MNETEYPSTHHLHWQKEEIPLKSRAFIKSVREELYSCKWRKNIPTAGSGGHRFAITGWVGLI